MPCRRRYLDRWSALTTWLNDEPPVDGDFVVVPHGQAVVRCAPARLPHQARPCAADLVFPINPQCQQILLWSVPRPLAFPCSLVFFSRGWESCAQTPLTDRCAVPVVHVCAWRMCLHVTPLTPPVQLLDVPTPNLSVLLVQGVLVFADDVPELTLDAEYIFIFGGVFEVGTKDAPFTNKATITLHGTRCAQQGLVTSARACGSVTLPPLPSPPPARSCDMESCTLARRMPCATTLLRFCVQGFAPLPPPAGDRMGSIELPLIGAKVMAVMDFPFGFSSNMDMRYAWVMQKGGGGEGLGTRVDALSVFPLLNSQMAPPPVPCAHRLPSPTHAAA
jgi:hypothetical protein